MTSIARPIRFAPRTGVPTWPFSIKNPSLTPNTKSPVAGLTCPPPSEVTHTPCSVASRMSPGLEEPLRMFVLVMRGTGGKRVGLAPAVPGGRHALLVGAQPVVEEPLQHAVGEQHRVLRRLAFVVERERTPAVGDRGVVDAVEELTAAPLTHQAGVHAGFLVDRVGLERMPDRLVEQDPAHAGREHHGHLAGRRRDRIEHRHGALGRHGGGGRRRVLVHELDAGTCRRTVEPGLDVVAALGHHLRHQADPGPCLLDPAAIGGRRSTAAATNPRRRPPPGSLQG